MSVALAAQAPITFEIKSASLALVALLLKSPDLGLLSKEMKQRFGDMPDFFDHDPVVIDLTPLQASDLAHSPVDFPELVKLLRGYCLVPAAVRGGNEAQTAAALLAGLIQANDASIHRAASASAVTAVAAPAPVSASSAPPPSLPPQAPPPAAPPAGAMVIDKPLRSGQQVYARGRDLVVLAMVNPGAEVIADGHIHVYAPLRGKAIAGARGNTDARIFALSMDPELISIAGIYRTSENPLPSQVLGHTAQVRLAPGPDGDKLLFEPLAA